MKNLLLVGAGQIGSRYLQGIAGETANYNITVIDSSAHSLSAAKQRWLEAGGLSSCHKIFWGQTLPNDIKSCDLAIVATSSKNRAALIQDIAHKINVNYWVIEKILAQSNKELNIIETATSNAKQVYVNTPRRQIKWYQKIRSKFQTYLFLISMKIIVLFPKVSNQN